jgi:hypothetical protein
VYAGGDFSSIGGQARSRIAALDSTGAATSFDPNANNSVYALAVSGGTVYAGGGFSSIGGQTRNNIAALDSAGTATSFDPNANSSVYALAVSGGTVYAGGSFSSFDRAAQQGFAQFTSPDTTKPSVSILTPAAGATYAFGSHVNANYSCADELGGSGVKSCVGTAANGQPINTSSPGGHGFKVTATDNDGNTSEKTVSYTVTPKPPVKDTKPPQTSITKHPRAKITTRHRSIKVSFGFKSSEAHSTFKCKIDKGPFRACRSSKPYTIKPGKHTFQVYATDKAGNRDKTSAKFTFKVRRKK